MFCMRCGSRQDDEAAFCNKCGAPMAAQSSPSETPAAADAPGRQAGKTVVLVVLLVILLAFAGAGAVQLLPRLFTTASPTPSVSKYVITVSGDATYFTGTIAGVNADGQFTSKTVEGYPDIKPSYIFNGASCSVVFQNKGSTGTLTVTIYRQGVVIGKQSTDAEFGVITLAVG